MSAPSGSIDLAIGQVTVHLVFPSLQFETFAFAYLYVEHRTAPNPIPIRIIPGVRTFVGDSVAAIDLSLTASPDELGYVLRWGIA